MARREREILEHAVRTVAEQAVEADELVDEAKAAGGGDHPVTVHAKMLRLELLRVKADLERELEDFVLNCSKCGLDVHWVPGLGVTPGHWGQARLVTRCHKEHAKAACSGGLLTTCTSPSPGHSSKRPFLDAWRHGVRARAWPRDVDRSSSVGMTNPRSGSHRGEEVGDERVPGSG
jgi:hypothetical protein